MHSNTTLVLCFLDLNVTVDNMESNNGIHDATKLNYNSADVTIIKPDSCINAPVGYIHKSSNSDDGFG